mgnify:CR=1 FL=1
MFLKAFPEICCKSYIALLIFYTLQYIHNIYCRSCRTGHVSPPFVPPETLLVNQNLWIPKKLDFLLVLVYNEIIDYNPKEGKMKICLVALSLLLFSGCGVPVFVVAPPIVVVDTPRPLVVERYRSYEWETTTYYAPSWFWGGGGVYHHGTRGTISRREMGRDGRLHRVWRHHRHHYR